jgi:hypothetical protein
MQHRRIVLGNKHDCHARLARSVYFSTPPQ